MEQLKEIRKWWSGHSNSRTNKKGKPPKKGFKVLFDGASHADKILAADLLANEFKKELHRIDLSRVVSKYIGETEKNLAAVLKKAEDKDWILFFDKADALFGKRTEVGDAHDRYANQETSYLLQAMETYPGLVILATNLKGNIDTAFTRRFQAVLKFPIA